MGLNSYINTYHFLSTLEAKADERSACRLLRRKVFSPTLKKVAFDTRYINQDTEMNPRRNLQFYQRSEPYISDSMEQKINLFFKVKQAADSIKQEYIGEPDWLDSYTRILCNAVDQTLRVEQKDCNYSDSQLGYLSELLYVRYRLDSDALKSMASEDIRKVVLGKDERLTRRAVFVNYKGGLEKNNSYEPPKQAIADVKVIQQDTLMDKLFTEVRATKENKKVKRSVTIVVEDSLPDEEAQENQEMVKSADKVDINKAE